MDPPSTSTPGTAGAGGGHIHFVTPTNRWLGSIPLSTLDPLTLEPLSTYVRPDPQKKTKRKTGDVGDEEVEEVEELDEEEDVEDMKERTTNIAGDPISLILARLQTNPQGCACGCTVPDPPKHSDYYHAQHLLRLLFQTQRVRSRSLKMYLPGFFERFGQDEDSEDEGCDFENGQEQDWEREQQGWQGGQGYPRDAVVIPMEGSSSINNNSSVSTLALPISPLLPQPQRQQLPQSTKRPKKIPRYVHSLVQNRNFRNPLTNTDIQGDATFFAVLEPGRGGWWHEPWAVAMQRPKGVEEFHSLLHRQQSSHSQKEEREGEKEVNEKGGEDEGERKRTPEMIQLEKELRKERWRQGRTVNLELEAQHEMDWRRWNRSQATHTAEAEAQAEVDRDFTHPGTDAGGQASVRRRRGCGRKMMRLKLGRDIALLEPSERGLRLPRRVRSRSGSSGTEMFDRSGKRTNALSLPMKKDVVGATSSTVTNTPVGDLYRSVQASAVLDDVELEDIRQQQRKQEQEQEDVSEKAQQYLQGRRGPHRRVTNKCRRRLARVHRTTVPSPPSSATTATTSSEGATPGFSFLPWWDPDPRPFQMPTTKLSPFAISTLPEPVAKLFGGTSIYSHTTPPSKTDATATTNNVSEDSSVSSTTTTNTNTSPTPATMTTPTKNTAGCQWVPVKRGDRVAVMIGTSNDFLLFPSFQRLLFRHLSREDFDDRVARVNRIPCPATAIVVTNAGGGGAAQSVQQQMREQGNRMQQELLQRQQLQQEEEQGEERARDVAALEEGEGSTTAAVATTGRGRTWMSWMSPRRRQYGTGASNNGTPATITTRTVDTTAIGPELGVRLPLPPSSESTTAFVDGSSSSSSSSSASSSSGRSSGEEERRRGLVEDEKCGKRVEESDRTPSNNNQSIGTIDEKAATVAALGSTIITTNNLPTSTNTAHGTWTSEESPKEKAQRWQALEERFLREDYDSSEYSYASSSDEEEDELPLDYDGPYYSSEESGSSDDGGEGSDDEERDEELQGGRRGSRGGRGGGDEAATGQRRWGILDWIYFFTFCTPHPRTLTASDPQGTPGRSTTTTGTGGGGGPFESRRARRRRLRRERWHRIQQRQREQESESLHRFLPVMIRRRMTAQDVHRCCMVAEFCRFYLTILMALFLMVAIVYGAVHAEASPPPQPKPSQAEWQGQVKDVVAIGGGGGGSLRSVPAKQWTSKIEVETIGASRGGEVKGDSGGQPKHQQPLGTIVVL